MNTEAGKTGVGSIRTVLKDHPIRESTKLSYAKAVAAACNHSRSKRRISFDEPVFISLTNIAQDLIDREDISQNSKLASRAALLHWLKNHSETNTPDWIVALSILKSMDRTRGRPTTNRPKCIKESELNLLLQEVNRRATKNKSEWAVRCEAWILAGLACGARPVEWLNTEWLTPEKTHLRIKNAKKHLAEPAFNRGKEPNENIARKTSNNISGFPSSDDHVLDVLMEREYPDNADFYEDPSHAAAYERIFDEAFGDGKDGHEGNKEGNHDDGKASDDNSDREQHSEDGVYRIVLVEVDSDRIAIDRHLALIEEIIPKSFSSQDREYLFSKYHRACGQTMNRCSERVWSSKKIFSFYSLRKQFSANMKAAYGSTVAAGLMGHSGPDSPSAASYGKANQAHKHFKAKGASTLKWRPTTAIKSLDKSEYKNGSGSESSQGG
jgi:hypothetical protein